MCLENILLGTVKNIGENVVKNVLNATDENNNHKEKQSVMHEKNINEKKLEYTAKNNVELRNEIEQKNKINLINAYGRNKRLGVMVVCAVIGLIICLLILTLCRDSLSGEVIGIVSTISGIFGACLKDAYSFEFGSSRGSREKDERLSATLLDHLKI